MNLKNLLYYTDLFFLASGLYGPLGVNKILARGIKA